MQLRCPGSARVAQGSHSAPAHAARRPQLPRRGRLARAQQQQGGPAAGQEHDQHTDAEPAQHPALASMLRADGHMLFAIPPAALSTPVSDVLACPTMRDILGPPRPNPLVDNLKGIYEGRFVSDDDRVALNAIDYGCASSTGAHRMGSDGDAAAAQAAADVWVPLPAFAMRAGPREEVYFDAGTVTAAIVTLGNICPGMNDTIEAMVRRLWDYGVPEDQILGIRYGMRGFSAKDAKPVVLTRERIDGIHLTGGTILGTSNDHRMHRRHHHHHHHRGHHHKQHLQAQADAAVSALAAGAASSAASSNSGGSSSSSSSSSDEDDEGVAAVNGSDASTDARLEAILDKLAFWRINMLLVIGGQGGNLLAAQLADGCKRRAIPCCIVGVPKSIDNDVMLVDKTFGFETVVQEVVQRPLMAAKVEAMSARKGVGLVKVFGRQAGFIALQASLASGTVDICLIPEEPFELDGPCGVLAYLEALLAKHGHAVICVSEGAGQDLLYHGSEAMPVDEAGNPLLKDIGAALKKAIKRAIPDSDVKYIDPSNMVQAVPCNAADHIFCRVLGMHAVDVAFAGYSGVLIGPTNGHFAMLPSSLVAQSTRRVDPRGRSWNRLRAANGQPRFINPGPHPAGEPQPAAAVGAAQA